MLTITIPDREYFDDDKEEFVIIPGQTIALEHSLVSVSKWEAKYHVPFLSNIEKKTEEQVLDYIKFMTLTQHVRPEVYGNLSKENVEAIQKYIDDKMTATWFTEDTNRDGTPRRRPKPNGEVVTSELIYYWMVAYQIPFECQKWHLNRLLTLIRVCNVKQEKPKNMSKKQLAARNTALNEARRAKLKSKG